MSDSVSTANVSSAVARPRVAASESVASAQSTNAAIAYGILRLSLGANIMLHGVSRLIAGHAAFLAYLNHYFAHTSLMPPVFLSVFGAVEPWLETIFGLMIFLGIGTRVALIGGGLLMTALVIGTNLAQDWVVAGLQLIYCFIYYYLLLHIDQNRFSIDQWRQGTH